MTKSKKAAPASARSAKSSKPAHDDLDEQHGHDHEDEHDEEEENDDSDDPLWFIPYLVLGGLVLAGISGVLFLPAAGGAHTEAKAEAASDKPATSAAARQMPSAMMSARPPQESISAQHLLVMHKEGQRAPKEITRTKDEAKARAEEAFKKLKAGTDFDALVKEYTDEPGSKDKSPPGTLGSFTRGRMVKPFEDAAFALKPGETSPIVETAFGFHIIKRLK